ncbi:MAG: hypothetical protein ACKO43_04070, partial [Alphaproteobacteria bacterium]
SFLQAFFKPCMARFPPFSSHFLPNQPNLSNFARGSNKTYAQPLSLRASGGGVSIQFFCCWHFWMDSLRSTKIWRWPRGEMNSPVTGVRAIHFCKWDGKKRGGVGLFSLFVKGRGGKNTGLKAAQRAEGG